MIVRHPAKDSRSPAEALLLAHKRSILRQLSGGGCDTGSEPRTAPLREDSGFAVPFVAETPTSFDGAAPPPATRRDVMEDDGPPTKKCRREDRENQVEEPAAGEARAQRPQPQPDPEPVPSATLRPARVGAHEHDQHKHNGRGQGSSAPTAAAVPSAADSPHRRKITSSEQDAVLALSCLRASDAGGSVPPAVASGPPAPSPKVWVCDVCHSLAFTNYAEACVHEAICRRAAAVRRANVAAAAMAAVARDEAQQGLAAGLGEAPSSDRPLEAAAAAFSPRGTRCPLRHGQGGVPPFPCGTLESRRAPTNFAAALPPPSRRGALPPTSGAMLEAGAIGTGLFNGPRGGRRPEPKLVDMAAPAENCAAAVAPPRKDGIEMGQEAHQLPSQGQEQPPQQEGGGEDGQGISADRFKPFHLEKWMDRFEELKRFKELHGHCLIPHKFPANPQLARWCKRQRRQYKLMKTGLTSTMTAARIEMLEAVGFVWDCQEATWREKVQELRKYRQLHGNCEVPSNYAGNKQLAIWVKCQRRMYSLYLEGKPCSITPERITELEREGFVWSIRNPGRKDASASAATMTTKLPMPHE